MTEDEKIIVDLDRDVVCVAGPDATSFLQSLVSQDLDPVPVGGVVHTLLLQPQGKVLVDFRAGRAEADTWWLACERGYGETLLTGLNRFKIRVKADIDDVTDAFTAFALIGGRRDDVPATPDALVDETPLGVEVFGPREAVARLRAHVDASAGSADDYERARIEAGVARMGFDIDERTIPQEAGLDRDAVSFTKGCFVGQELVCRIDTRGHVNRCLRRLRADRPLVAGSAVTAAGKAVGEVTSAAGGVALAMVRREVDPGSVVDAGGVPAALEALNET